MIFCIFTFCIALTMGHVVLEGQYTFLSGDYDDFQWPDTYKIQATKMSLTSGLVEYYSAWKTNDSSRIDYNKGAVKSFILLNVEGAENGLKYKVHPQNLYSPISTLVCEKIIVKPLLNLTLESILPHINSDDLSTISNETLLDKKTVKFDYSYIGSNTFIWARHQKTEYGPVWVPIRYELIIYDTDAGSLNIHEIWDFYNFETDFSDDVFDIDAYDCPKHLTDNIVDSDAITDDLMFIDENENEIHVDHAFNAFKTTYNRHYAHSNEHELRKSIFQRNMRLITSKNNQNLGYKLAINKFADRTPEEMKNFKGLLKRPAGSAGNIPFPYSESELENISRDWPLEYDLRNYGLISTVKSQEDCGSCWAFAVTSAVEGALARVNGGKLMSLSTQAMVDCGWEFGSMGCKGGYDSKAYEWMMKYGLPTDEEYGPYTNQDGFCNISNMTKKYPIRGYTDVTSFSVPALKVALINHGPLSVSLQVTPSFHLYSSGIFYDQECATKEPDHEVALVGYGNRDGEDFWILKNSWGRDWGEAGYMLISTRNNDCGIATKPTYVVF